MSNITRGWGFSEVGPRVGREQDVPSDVLELTKNGLLRGCEPCAPHPLSRPRTARAGIRSVPIAFYCPVGFEARNGVAKRGHDGSIWPSDCRDRIFKIARVQSPKTDRNLRVRCTPIKPPDEIAGSNRRAGADQRKAYRCRILERGSITIRCQCLRRKSFHDRAGVFRAEEM